MLRLTIISPERIIFKGDVYSVLVPGTLGSFEILNDHAPIISSLTDGKVEYDDNGEKKQFDIHGGFVEVKKNEVSLCVEL